MQTPHNRRLYSRTKEVYKPSVRLPSRGLAGSGSRPLTNIPHCCLIFLTAASRRSLVRVSVPVWGTFLSEPLSIVGLVGRYPANCLMERMPIHQRIAPFNKYHHVVPLFHRVLIHLSMACPRLMGRLHTRYSPVRRSPPGHCCPVMPLDLHVLSLPLAFILSQDQTLRCLFILLSFSSSP